MRRNRRHRIASAPLAAGVAMAALLGACGQGDSDDGDAATGGEVTAADAGDGGGRDPGNEEWCRFAGDLDEGLEETERLDVFDPASLQELYGRVEATLDEARDAAPEEISDDVATLGDGFQRLVEVLEEAEWDVARISATDIALLDDPRYIEAADRIERFSVEVCGLTPDTTSPAGAAATGAAPPGEGLDRIVSALTELGFSEEDARCIAQNVLGGDASRLSELLADPQALADACGLSLADLGRVTGGG